MTNAGLHGTPQIVAPGCNDLVEIVGWQPIPEMWAGHLRHEHNRLLTSIVLTDDERVQVAKTHRLACHINHAAFAEKALEVFDEWRAVGVIE